MARDFEESSGQRITFTPNADYTSKLAISFWVKAESLPGGHQMHFVDKGKNNAGNNRNFATYWTPAGGGMRGISWDNPAGTYHEWSNNSSPSTSAWEHWYFEVDWTTNPDTVLFWVNGSSVTLTNSFGSNNTTPLTTATQQISIGGEHGSADNNNSADGLIAEVGIWSDNVGAARAAMLAKGYAPSFFKNNLTEYIPLVRDLQNLKGGTGTLSSSNPTVADHPRIIYPTSAILMPGAATSTGVTVNPTVQTATFSQPSATVTAKRNVSTSAAVQTATFSQPAPTITAVRNVSISAGVQSITSSQPTATTSINETLSQSVQSATFSQPAPTVSTIRNLSVSPGVQSTTFSAPVASVSIKESLAPAVQTATFSQQTITVTAKRNVTVSPGVQSITSSQPAASVSVNEGLAQAVQTATFSQPSASITAIRNVLISAAVQSLTFSQTAVDISFGDLQILPNVQALSFSLLSPTVTAVYNELPVYNPPVTWSSGSGGSTTWSTASDDSEIWTDADSPQGSQWVRDPTARRPVDNGVGVC